MSRGKFAVLLIGSLALVALLRAGVPAAFHYSRGLCSGGGSGCSALAIVVGMSSGLTTVIVFMASMITIFYRRLKATDLSLLWLLAVIFFTWESNKFIYGVGNLWAANFSSGILWLQFPYAFMALMGFGIFLTVYKSPVSEALPSGHRRAWKVAASMVPVILIASSFLIVAMVGRLLGTVLPTAAVVIFLAALAYIAFVPRSGEGETPKRVANSPDTAPVSARRKQFGTRKASSQRGFTG